MRVKKKLPTQEVLNDLILYDPYTGNVNWKCRDRKYFPSDWSFIVWNKSYENKPITCKNHHGYLYTTIFGSKYLLHRLIWKLMFNEEPSDLDHINGVRDDNRLQNLRVVNHQENMRNMRKVAANSSGYTGVYKHTQNGRWVAQISVDNKTKYLGIFHSIEDAIICRKKAELMYNFHDNNGQVAGVGV